jgi:hypothetical protein
LPVISAFRRLTQGYHEFETSLGYVVRFLSCKNKTKHERDRERERDAFLSNPTPILTCTGLSILELNICNYTFLSTRTCTYQTSALPFEPCPQLFCLLRWDLTNFALWALTGDLLASASQAAGITGIV